MHRRALLAAAVVAALLSCSHAGLPDVLLPDQVTALAREAVLHTPEHVHFAAGTKFDWVLFVPGEETEHPEVIAAIRSELKQRYTVFSAEAELPPGAVRDDGFGTTYVGGFLYSVSIKQVAPDTLEVTYHDYEGSLAGGSQTVRYQWRDHDWRVVGKSEQILS